MGITASNFCLFLPFRLGNSMYALDRPRVQKILCYKKINYIPRIPEYLKGVTKFNGVIVPVIELRIKFGMSKTEKIYDTNIIIVEIRKNNSPMLLGLLVDSVEDLFDLNPIQVESNPDIGSRLRINYIKGMASWYSQFIFVLDVDKLFSNEELALILKTEKNMSTEQLEWERQRFAHHRMRRMRV